MTIILILLLLPQTIFGLPVSNNAVGAQFESPKSENELKFEYYGKEDVSKHLNNACEGKEGTNEKKNTGGIEECSKITQEEKTKKLPTRMHVPPENKEITAEIKKIEAGSESEGPETAEEVAKPEPRAICPPKNEGIEEKEGQQGITTKAEFCSPKVNKCFKYKSSSDPSGKTCEQHCIGNFSCTSFAIRTAVNGTKLERGNFCVLEVKKCPKEFKPFNKTEECNESTFEQITSITKTAKVLAFSRFIVQNVWAINVWTAKKIALPLVKSVMSFTRMFPQLAFPLYVFMYFIGWENCLKIVKKMLWFLWNYGGLIAKWIWSNPKLAMVGFAVIGSGAYVHFPTLLSFLLGFGAFVMKALEFLKDLLGKHVEELGEKLKKLTGEKALECPALQCPPVSCSSDSGVTTQLQLKNMALETKSQELLKQIMDLTKKPEDLAKSNVVGDIFEFIKGIRVPFAILGPGKFNKH